MSGSVTEWAWRPSGPGQHLSDPVQETMAADAAILFLENFLVEGSWAAIVSAA